MQQTQQTSPSSSTGSLTRKLKGRNWFWKLKLCTSCVSPLGRIPFSNSGANCPQCGLRVCKNCRHYLDESLTFGDHQQYQHNWVCILCRSSPNQYTGPKSGAGKSIRRSWTISNPQRGQQQNSPILKSYTIYNEDNSIRQSNHRQFNSLPRLNYSHASVQDENQLAVTCSTGDEKINYSSSTLYPFTKNNKSNSNSSVNFIEDVYWDYFGTSVFAPDSARSSCERSLGEIEYCSNIIETDRYQNSNNSNTKNINSISGSINDNNNINNSNNSSSQKGKCTTIPIKPERANKRSNSLNAYDGKKLSFSPLRTYVVLRQPTTNNNNTKKRSSSFNLDYCGGKRNRANLNSTEYEDYRDRLDEIKSLYSDRQKRPLSEKINNVQQQQQQQQPVNINKSTNRKGFIENDPKLIRDIREPLMKLKRSESANSSLPITNYNLHRHHHQSEDQNINNNHHHHNINNSSSDSTFLFGTLPKRKPNYNNIINQSQLLDNSYSSLDRRRHYNIPIEREQQQIGENNQNKKFPYSSITTTDKIPIHHHDNNNSHSNFSSLPLVLSNSPQLKQAKYFHREDTTNNITPKSSASPVFNRSPISSSSSSSSSPIPKPPRKSLNRGNNNNNNNTTTNSSNMSSGKGLITPSQQQQQQPYQMSTLPKSFSYGMRKNDKVDPNLEMLLKKSEKILNPGGMVNKSNNGNGNVNVVQIVSNQTFPRRKPLTSTNICSSSSSFFEPNIDVHSSLDREYLRNKLKVNSSNSNNNTFKNDESSTSSCGSICAEEVVSSTEEDEVNVSKLNHEDEHKKKKKKQKEMKVIVSKGGKGDNDNNDEEATVLVGGWEFLNTRQQVLKNSSNSASIREDRRDNIKFNNINIGEKNENKKLTDLSSSQYAHYDTRDKNREPGITSFSSKNHVSTQPLSFIDSNSKSQQQEQQQEQNNSNKSRNEFVTTVQINNDMCYYEPNLNPILRIYQQQQQPTIINKTQEEEEEPNLTILQNRYPISNSDEKNQSSLLKSNNNTTIPFQIPIEIEKDKKNNNNNTNNKKVPLTTITSTKKLSPPALSTKYNKKNKNNFTSLLNDTNNKNNDNKSCDNTDLTSTTKITSSTSSEINEQINEQSKEDNFDSASSVSTNPTDNSSDDTIIDCSQLKLQQSFTTNNNNHNNNNDHVSEIYAQGSNVNVDSTTNSIHTGDLIKVNNNSNVGGEENSINIHEPKHADDDEHEHENSNTNELKKENLVIDTKQTISIHNSTNSTIQDNIKSETEDKNPQESISTFSNKTENSNNNTNNNLTDKIKKLVFGPEDIGQQQHQQYSLDQILQLQRDIISLEKDNETSSQSILPTSPSSSFTSDNSICQQENNEQQQQQESEKSSINHDDDHTLINNKDNEEIEQKEEEAGGNNNDDCKSEDGILQECAPNLQQQHPLPYQNNNNSNKNNSNFDLTKEFQRFCDISQKVKGKENLLESLHVFETEIQLGTIHFYNTNNNYNNENDNDNKNTNNNIKTQKGGGEEETEEEKGIQDITDIEDDDDDSQIYEQNDMNHYHSNSNSYPEIEIEEIFEYQNSNSSNNNNNNTSTSNSLPYDIEYQEDITDKNDNTNTITTMDHERFERLTPEGEESFTDENTTKQVQRTSPDGARSPDNDNNDDKINKLVNDDDKMNHHQLVDEDSFQVTSSDSDNSWIEEIPYEEEGFPPLDLTLHTIVEESCEDSCEDEAECLSLKEQLVNRRPIDDLENYFNYLDPANAAANSSSDPLNLPHYDYHGSPQQQHHHGNHHHHHQQQYLAHEDSEFSDTFSESSFNSEIHQNHEDENSMLELENNAVDLASTRLEKYFTNLNYSNTNRRSSNSEQTGGGGGYPEDSEDSVGSESENDDHLQDKRKKVLKHKRTAKECGDGDDESIIFDQDEGHFDTIKKSSKKKSDSNNMNTSSSNCDVEREPSESNFMYHSYDDDRSMEMAVNNDNSSGSIQFASTNQEQSSSAAATPTTVPKSKQVNRSNSFQWSSDEEVNQMMSKLRHLIKNLMQKNPHPTSAETSSSLNSQSQLRYFETELIRLMRQEPQLKNIVSEYISSEESDDNNEFNQFIKEVVNQEQQFDNRYPSSSSSSSSFKRDSTDSPLLPHKLQQPLGQSNSPALIAKVMHHIGNRLSVWMKDEEEEREGTLKQVSSVSSDLNEDRFSWKGSFESTLAAKRQSVGSTDSISSSDFNNPHNSQNTLGVDRILRSSSLHHLANSQPIEEKKEEEDNISNISNSLPRLNVANMSRAQSLIGIKEKVKSARYRPPGFQQAPSIIKQIDDKMSVSTPSLHHDHSPDTPINLRSSADSISSMLEHGVGRINVRGSIEFGLGYNYKQASLEFRVKQCRDLASVDTKRNRSDPYVKVYLLPDRSKSGKRKTKTKKNTLNPIFEETLKFPVTISELQKRILWISVWHSDIFGKNEFLGQVLLNLKDRVFDDTSPTWYNLEQYNSGMPEQEQEDSREDLQLIIALKWQPQTTTSRNQSTGTLSVLIKEAKNLTLTKNQAPSTFVKVCPIKESKTHRSKHKTSVARRTLHPVWNTTLILEDVILEDGVEISLWNVYDLLSNSHLLSSMKLDSDVPLWEAMCNRPNFWIEGQLALKVTFT